MNSIAIRLDFRMGFYYSFDPNNGEFCRPFPIQAAFTWCMIVMAPNNRWGDPVLRGKLPAGRSSSEG
jgi:hypothetical protein